MILINGEILKTSYFSNTEVRIKEFTRYIKSAGNYIELKYETERSNYKINNDLMILYFVKQEFDSMGIDVSLVLWSMPYQRMDHKNADDILTLPFVAKFLNDLNFKKILVIEPHSEKTKEYLRKDAVIVYPVADWINNAIINTDSDNVVVAFPDAGAYERYKDSLDTNIKTCVFSKKRDHKTNEIVHHKILRGDIAKGSTCFIVDDICSSGGTLLDVADYAKSVGAAKVIVIVAHCENEALKREILKPESSVDMMYTSNSMISAVHPKIAYMKIDEENIRPWLK